MVHLPLFKIMSWNKGMRCMSFYDFVCRQVISENNAELLAIANFRTCNDKTESKYEFVVF